MPINARRFVLGAAAVAAAALAGAIALAQTPSPPGATVYFINLKDGDAVMSPFKVQFGLTSMGVAPVGITVDRTGHHHLIIDTQMSADDLKRLRALLAAQAKKDGGSTR